MNKEKIENSLLRQMNNIRKAPLFLGISTEMLKEILLYCKVIQHDNNTILFLQDEKRSHVYMLLKGVVKLFKNNRNGSEIIFKIATNDDSFLEIMTLVGSHYITSAQTVTNTELLVIPEYVLQKYTMHNNTIATNMLALSNIGIQTLSAHIELLTLKTAQQRVGWYLLQLFLKNNEYKKEFQLPHDKLLIASYLGMKPETFSRTLRQLKENGVNIKHNRVLLEKDFALCEYCSSDVMRNCSRSETPDCIPGN